MNLIKILTAESQSNIKIYDLFQTICRRFSTTTIKHGFGFGFLWAMHDILVVRVCVCVGDNQEVLGLISFYRFV